MEIYKIRVYNFIGFCCSTYSTFPNSLIIIGGTMERYYFYVIVPLVRLTPGAKEGFRGVGFERLKRLKGGVLF